MVGEGDENFGWTGGGLSYGCLFGTCAIPVFMALLMSVPSDGVFLFI